MGKTEKCRASPLLTLLAIRLDAVLKAEKLPARVSDLHTGLSKLNQDNLAHCNKKAES